MAKTIPTPTWLRRIRERLEKPAIGEIVTGVKWKDLGSIMRFIKPILEEGAKEEEYMTKTIHKQTYGDCDCNMCKKQEE